MPRTMSAVGTSPRGGFLEPVGRGVTDSEETVELEERAEAEPTKVTVTVGLEVIRWETKAGTWVETGLRVVEAEEVSADCVVSVRRAGVKVVCSEAAGVTEGGDVVVDVSGGVAAVEVWVCDVSVVEL